MYILSVNYIYFYFLHIQFIYIDRNFNSSFKIVKSKLQYCKVLSLIIQSYHNKRFSSHSKCHQRAIDSMQASLEAEAKGRAEALRMKKKLESDINELEIALDHANKANSDLQKHIKKLQGELKDMSVRVEEEQRLSAEYREQYGIAERRANALNGELEESRTLLEQSDRGRRQAEGELAEASESLNDVTAQANSLGMAKRKLEAELTALHVSMIIILCLNNLLTHLKEYKTTLF